MCGETHAMLIVFSGLNLAGMYFDLCVREALWNEIHILETRLIPTILNRSAHALLLTIR